MFFPQALLNIYGGVAVEAIARDAAWYFMHTETKRAYITILLCVHKHIYTHIAVYIYIYTRTH